MKAAVYDGKDIKIKNLSDPTIYDSQVLVRVKAVGICGTDLAIRNGHLPTPLPIILGHEFSGKVVALGKSVEKTWLNK
ncbi:MAG: alcohol dehydrogenase catalytic domain-containing protein, partial [Candidatus Lokiarchaeia archaeon]|nr:alcohol dehydrogenase catalytic domain-containing protein [Candidatus Lokiarchaeia archaeon]